MENIEIGISGLGVGPFPKPNEIGHLVGQWCLLPRAKMLGFNEEELTAYLVELFNLLSGVSVSDLARIMRNDLRTILDDPVRHILPHIKTGALTTAQKLPKTPSETESGEYEPMSWMMEEKAADILALVTALWGYFSSVERIGQDKANAFSLWLYADLRSHAHELNLPVLLAELQKGSPGQFTKRLREYPNSDDDASFFAGATVFTVQEGKGKLLSLSEFVKGLQNQSIVMPARYMIIPPELRGRKPDLHDPAYYLDSLLASLIIGGEDLITKGVNLRVAQEEGLAIMDGDYAELGGDQGIAESLAQDYLDKRSQGISKASLLDGEAFRRAVEGFDTLESLMTRFKKESTRELEEAEALRKLGQPKSLDEEMQSENGEVRTLAEMIPASANLEEAMPQLLEIFEKELEPEDAELLKERFIDDKSITEIAIERDWEYDSAQKHICRLVNAVRKKMS